MLLHPPVLLRTALGDHDQRAGWDVLPSRGGQPNRVEQEDRHPSLRPRFTSLTRTLLRMLFTENLCALVMSVDRSETTNAQVRGKVRQATETVRSLAC